MPSTMMHIVTALQFYPNASTLFLIGTIAPDVIKERKEKDKSHYRDVANRAEWITRFARSIRIGDEFKEGTLLHLYLDWKWDEGPFAKYKREHENEDWFPAYRREIDLSGSFMFHHMDSHNIWREMTSPSDFPTFPKIMDSHNIWREMLALDESRYGEWEGASPRELKAYIQYLYQWFIKNDIGPSRVFTPPFLEAFVKDVVEDYKRFRNEIGI